MLTNSSTQNKLSVLKRVFKLYNEDPNDLVFYLRDNNSQAEEEAGTRFEVRRKYWAFALEKIKEANSENHMFRTVTPAKGNWIKRDTSNRTAESMAIEKTGTAAVVMPIFILKSKRRFSFYVYSSPFVK